MYDSQHDDQFSQLWSQAVEEPAVTNREDNDGHHDIDTRRRKHQNHERTNNFRGVHRHRGHLKVAQDALARPAVDKAFPRWKRHALISHGRASSGKRPRSRPAGPPMMPRRPPGHDSDPCRPSPSKARPPAPPRVARPGTRACRTTPARTSRGPPGRDRPPRPRMPRRTTVCVRPGRGPPRFNRRRQRAPRIRSRNARHRWRSLKNEISGDVQASENAKTFGRKSGWDRFRVGVE